jgi:hypothetical protein
MAVALVPLVLPGEEVWYQGEHYAHRAQHQEERAG